MKRAWLFTIKEHVYSFASSMRGHNEEFNAMLFDPKGSQ